MKFDEIYAHIGSFGVFQCCFYVSIFVVNLVLNDVITLIFADARIPHFCRVPQLTNVSHSMQKYIAIPYASDGLRSDGQAQRYSACEMYAFNYSAFQSDDFLNWNRSQRTQNTTLTVTCNDWVYDRSTYDSTTVARVRDVRLELHGSEVGQTKLLPTHIVQGGQNRGVAMTSNSSNPNFL